MLFKISHGDSSRISPEVTPIHPGWCWFTDNDGKLYIDSADEDGNNAKRTCINSSGAGTYVKTFSASDWASGKLTIPASEHKLKLENGCAGSNVFAIVDDRYTSQVFAAMDTDVSVDSNKNVVLSTPGDGFAGMVMLCGHHVASEQNQTGQGGGIPSGCILIWSGTADNIPTGWQLCDGTNGTPDLRDKFVLGAGTKHSVGETGGSEEVTLTVAQMPAHTHPVSGMIGAATKITPSTTGKSDAPHYTSYNTSSSGSSQPHPNMPPYYTLAYIMRM